MSIRHLESLFQPASIALIGASDQPDSLGTVIRRNLQGAGFKGPIWLVNPSHPRIGGQLVWPDVAALPGVPDLAVICTPAATVPGLIAELGAKGTRCAIVISAGLHAPAPDGLRTLQQAMLDAARPYLLRVLGPNCIGLIIPGIGLNASFAPANALPGKLAFVTQSGALATAMLDWANSRNIGFSHFVSLGDSADVDFGDVLDYLACDASTRAILMYAESISSARKFMSAARQAARNKPVIVVKAGRASLGARAAASHTGALAGSDVVLDAAFRRAGMLRVDTLEALFDAAETLAHARPFRGERLAILTNGGGAGVLAADALQLAGGNLATFAPQTLEALNACLPANWPHANPVDIIGDAPVARYRQALEVLLAAREVDAVLFMHAPTAVVPADASRVVAAADGSDWSLGSRVLRIRDTPGHAKHHFCIWDEASASWFTGDTFGIAYRELCFDGIPFLMPTTTPVQFDPAALHASIDLLMAAEPSGFNLTHFGHVAVRAGLAQTLHAEIDSYVRLCLAAPAGPQAQAALQESLTAHTVERLRAAGCRWRFGAIARFIAFDMDLNAAGLLSWRATAA